MIVTRCHKMKMGLFEIMFSSGLICLFIWLCGKYVRNLFTCGDKKVNLKGISLRLGPFFLRKTCPTVIIGLFLLFLALLLTMLSVSPSKSEPKDYDELRKVIGASLGCRGNPGMVVSIVKDGKTVFSEAFGARLPGSDDKVTTGTKFLIASLTKAFTAFLLMDVLKHNPRNISYSLSTPLRDILGQNFSFADEERTKYASAEDLLSHRIAFFSRSFMRMNADLKRSDFIGFVRYWRSNTTFRGIPRYNSMGYTLAAAILEYLGGKPLEDLMTERIFKPLGMESTGFAATTDFDSKDVAPPYANFRFTKGPINPVFTRTWNSKCGSGCIMSTAIDMVKWINFILSGGKNATGHQVFPVEEVNALTETRTYLRNSKRELITKPKFPVTSVANEYAMGWRNGYYRGYRILSHSGSSPGYSSMIMLYPGENMGIFVIMNGDDLKFYYRLALIHYIFDFMQGHQPWLNTTTLCTFPHPWDPPFTIPKPLRDTGLKPALPYIEYTGAYKHELYGEVFVNVDSHHLNAFFGVGSWQLIAHKEKHIFYGRGMGATNFWHIDGFQFITKDDDPKNITRLVIHGFDLDNPPVFEKEFDYN